MHHAIRAFRIAGFCSVLAPLGCGHQFFESVSVTILKQIAGLLPAKDVVGGHAPWRTRIVALAHQEFEEQRRHIESPLGIAVRQNGAEKSSRSSASKEVLLVRRFIVRVSRREHHAFDAQFHHFVKEGANTVGIGAVKQRRIRGNPESALQSLFDSLKRQIVSAFTADRKIVVLTLAIHVHGESQILAGTEQINFFLEQQRVGTQIDVFAALHQPGNDLTNLRMHERLASGNADHGRATFFYSVEALFRSELLLENVSGILDLAASGASQVAAEQWFQHEDKRIALSSSYPLLEDVAGYRPHL